jgi:FrmR/RcnR family transcriptional regulator, repressor of frmRAB operon
MGVSYVALMTHTIRNKLKLTARVRRIKGQVEAIERALENEVGCEKVTHLISAARGAMSSLMAEVVEEHVRTHLVDVGRHPGALNAEAADQLVDVVRTYLK